MKSQNGDREESSDYHVLGIVGLAETQIHFHKEIMRVKHVFVVYILFVLF